MMIKVITHKDKHDRYLLPSIYRLRHDVFAKTLRWVPESPMEEERDKYDDMGAIHFAHVENDGTVSGCFRLLPTTGDYLLKDSFSKLVYDAPMPNSASIMEVSRFAVDHRRDYRSGGTVSVITNRLLRAMYGFGLHHGLTEYVCVTDILFERLLGRAGLKTERFGPPRDFGNCRAVAGRAPISKEVLARLTARSSREDCLLPRFEDERSVA